MNIYTKEGWVDIPSIVESGFPFIFIIGGRGTGKTYGGIKRQYIDKKERTIYLRRTEVELDLCMTEELNPFRKVNFDTGHDIQVVKKKKMFRIDDGEDTIGMAFALSTVADVKSMSAEDVECILFDEFIRDRNKRNTIKDEAAAFFGFYETVNRNRELSGRKPLTALFLSNSGDVANPLFIELGLVSVCERAQRRGVYPFVYTSRERGILLIDLGPSSPISAKKSDTALYRLTKDTDYYKMAIENDYVYNPASRQAARPLREYRPIVLVGELGIYRHKSTGEYYVSMHKRGGAPAYEGNTLGLSRFRKQYSWLWLLYMRDGLTFESYTAESLLTSYFEK